MFSKFTCLQQDVFAYNICAAHESGRAQAIFYSVSCFILHMSENLADMLTRGTDALNLVQSLQLISFTLRTHDIAGVIWSL
jgi:hypothetical protein